MNNTDLSTLMLSIILLFCLFFTGRSIAGPKEIRAIQIPIGMFIIYFFFLICSIIINEFSIIYSIVFLFFLTLLGLIRSKITISRDLLFLSYCLIFTSPLLILASISQPFLWDDYTNWLPPAKFLHKYNHLPNLNEPILNSVNSSYSYMRALFHSFINFFFNEFIMNIQIIFNILIGSTLLLWSAPILRIFQNKNNNNLDNFSLMANLCFLLIIWIISLQFYYLFSSYSESSYLIIFLHLFLYLILIEGNDGKFSNGKFNWVLSMLFAIPLTIKEIGLYHSLIVFINYIIVFEIKKFFIDNTPTKIKIKKLLIQFSHLVPLFILQFLWSYYREKNLLVGGIRKIDLNQERFELIPDMLLSAKEQLLNNHYIVISIIISILILMFGDNSKKTKFINNKYLFLYSYMISISIILLTLLAYVVSFTTYEASRALSFSRYIAPAGFIVWSSIIIGFLNMNYKINSRLLIITGLISFIVFLFYIFSSINKINFNKDLDIRFKNIARDIMNNYPKNEKLLIIDLETNGIDAVKIIYYIGNYMPSNYVSSVNLGGNLNEKIITNWFNEYENIHIHSASKKQLDLIKKFLTTKQN